MIPANIIARAIRIVEHNEYDLTIAFNARSVSSSAKEMPSWWSTEYRFHAVGIIAFGDRVSRRWQGAGG